MLGTTSASVLCRPKAGRQKTAQPSHSVARPAMSGKRSLSRRSPAVHIRSIKTAINLPGNRVGYPNGGKTYLFNAGSKDPAMSGFAHRATETSRTAFGEIRPTASRPMSPYCGTRRMQEAEAAATQALYVRIAPGIVTQSARARPGRSDLDRPAFRPSVGRRRKLPDLPIRRYPVPPADQRFGPTSG